MEVLAKALSYIPTKDKLPRKNREVIALIWLMGSQRGYSWANIQNLVRQFNNEVTYGRFWKFLEHNCIFGMNVPTWSETAYLIPNGAPTAGYPSLLDCVSDRLDWDSRRGVNPKSDTYLEDIEGKGYNPSEEYAEVVARYESHHATILTQVVVIPALLLGVLYTYTRYK